MAVKINGNELAPAKGRTNMLSSHSRYFTILSIALNRLFCEEKSINEEGAKGWAIGLVSPSPLAC
jgi:hypothetical protein